MALAASGPSPIGESLQVARSNRISELSNMVFRLAPERFLGGTNHDFDDVEPQDLIAALRICGFYMIPVHVYTNNNLKNVRVQGNDGNHYIAEFSIREPLINLHVSRIRLASLALDPDPAPLVGSGFKMREIEIVDRVDVIPEYSTRLSLSGVTADQAFLVGMSLIISLMDDQDDDSEEEARLAPLLAMVMPTAEELREIRAGRPASTINYDEEGDQPF